MGWPAEGEWMDPGIYCTAVGCVLEPAIPVRTHSGAEVQARTKMDCGRSGAIAVYAEGGLAIQLSCLQTGSRVAVSGQLRDGVIHANYVSEIEPATGD